MSWHCTGLSWPGEGPADGPVLGWRGGDVRRVSALAYGRELGFRAEGERHCVGARGNPCPLVAVVPVRSTGARCPECARLDRAHSVAADTLADDPRPYRVYLAWFGPGTVKVGITGEARGGARLREQGAVVFSWLGRGPLMAARRTEELLRAALGVPDRIPYARKRAVRGGLPGTEERSAEVEGLYRRAVALEGAGWPKALERLPFEAVDHAGIFALTSAGAPVRAVSGLVDGGVVAGRLVAGAGPDLYLQTPADGTVVLDTRLITGWQLAAADARAGVSVPLVAVGAGGVQDGLF
ncbi:MULTISPECIES: DUF2797 domain-containing protein [unclassified Streptomyces]|uniref:DUF2797 domain-containing protein n=1 Tax=unclassified Streptomyces TaxID=2593676 RepID=UPI0001C1B5EE|nr:MULTISPECIES: DUF2797 domain-containing protein [unclassified Streptomyces]AEN11275.1 conserved hypothetical protein [Streptomyces sp. SirexAA-E]MYR67605.1 DUF2797 domain-containing protein [Streptomyces sp. SID4939]MYS02829.1 DUF2797 domain-containing protein [Streptomyces sp. SID4940]MYT63460.1 DUF2797 domain-containing protein [Streptomyces sp. SID8357]MYT85710.1 DUF2797 domain-containing protein [Streptomyces sp. SID8360]